MSRDNTWKRASDPKPCLTLRVLPMEGPYPRKQLPRARTTEDNRAKRMRRRAT